MIFQNLTMAGFKSFAEKVEMDIDPGLTGIVGPNGCGKSNIVEAMRWIMGESSARQMRGTEMDDIIFAGTEHRPARTSGFAPTMTPRLAPAHLALSHKGGSVQLLGQNPKIDGVLLKKQLISKACTSASETPN